MSESIKAVSTTEREREVDIVTLSFITHGLDLTVNAERSINISVVLQWRQVTTATQSDQSS